MAALPIVYFVRGIFYKECNRIDIEGGSFYNERICYVSLNTSLIEFCAVLNHHCQKFKEGDINRAESIILKVE
jgi:hypothetical protein